MPRLLFAFLLLLPASVVAARPDPSGRGRYAVGRTRMTFTKTSETTGQPRLLDDGPRFLVELLNSGHCAFAVGCIAAACGTGCEPTALPLPEAHRLTLRYAVPFFLRYVRGRDRFPRALRPDQAPAGVVVFEAHAGG